MIYAIVGKPGAGKSMCLTRMVRRWLNAGINVYTNLPIDERLWTLRPKHGKLFYLQDIDEFRDVNDGIIAIDELNFYFEARDWAKLQPEDRMKFQRHRHEQLDIFYTVQSFQRADVVIRQLTHEVWTLKNVLNLVWIINKYDAEDYERRTRPRRINHYPIIHLFSKKIANAYDTHQWAKKKAHEFTPMTKMFLDKQIKKMKNKNTQT